MQTQLGQRKKVIKRHLISRQLHISKETVGILIKIHIEWVKKHYKEDT